MTLRLFVCFVIAFALATSATVVQALPTAFTYQGRLEQEGVASEGLCDFEFRLFDAASAGTQVGPTQAKNLTVDAGLFTTTLDFGANAFTGADRWLDVAVRCPAGDGAFTLLAPRQPVMPTPYALFSMSAADDSISGAQIADGAVMTTDLADGAVTDAKVTSISYGKISGAPASLPPNGPAGGGLAGTYPNPGIATDAITAANLATDPESLAKLTGGALVQDNDREPPQVLVPGSLLVGEGLPDLLTIESNGIRTERLNGFSNLLLQKFGGGVVIGPDSPETSIPLQVTGDSAAIQVGDPAGPRTLLIDVSGISARNPADQPAPLFLQGAGSGDVRIAGGGGNVILASGGGFVGVRTSAPDTPLHVTGGTDAGPSGGGFVQIGLTAGGNVVLDDNEIMARNNRNVANLSVQNNGGDVIIDGVGTGGVAIGTTSTSGFRLAVNGSAAKPSGGSWSVLSDARLKRNVHHLDGALAKLLALHGVTFEYRDPDAIHELHGERTGFIAQEVERVFPDWVEENADGYKVLSVRGFEALTVEALRDLRTEREAALGALRKENAALRQRLDALETRLDECARRPSEG